MSVTLKRASIVMKLTSGKGSRIEIKWQSDPPNAAKPASPDRVLEGAADEIARIAELCGFGDRIEAAVREARGRVQEHSAREGGAA